MKTYEMLYVLDNAIEDAEKEAMASKFESIITSNGGEVVSTDKWGAKKLAYAIKYKTEGYYVLATIQANGAIINEIKRVAGISESVLRVMITKKEA